MRVDAIYRDGFNVTPSDTLLLPQRADALYVGGAGDVVVDTEGGNTVKFVGVPAGGLLPFSTQKVLSTGTTATSILGLVFFATYGVSGGSIASDIFIYDDSGVAVTDDSGNHLSL